MAEVKLSTTDAARETLRLRTELTATLAEIRDRMDPRVIAAETAENIWGKADRLVHATTAAVRTRPALALGGLGAFVAVLGARRWLARSKED